MTAAVLEAARGAYAAGLTILPVEGDGSKRPAVSEWGRFKTERPTQDQMRAWQWARQPGFGVVAGPSGGHTESWDFDTQSVFEAFCDAARVAGLGELLQRLLDGYSDETPRGGCRILARYPVEVEWRDVTLARRVAADGKTETLIELPTFAIVAPTDGRVHPNGRVYRRRWGDFGTIATYTADERDALIRLARSFDEMTLPVVHRQIPSANQGTRPGDGYASCTSWAEILEPHGWVAVYTRGDVTCWRRPDKRDGISATTNHGGSDLLYVFSSSAPCFEPERSYDKFGAYAALQHGGDYGAAARALAARGFGESRVTVSQARGQDPHGASGSPPAPPSAQGGDLAFTDLGALLVEPEQETRWVVDGLVATDTLNILAGKPKAGKSTMARDLAFSVATGGYWLGRQCTPGLVWYLAFEEKRDEVRRHFRAMGASGPESVRLFIERAPDDAISRIYAQAKREEPILIIVDTLQRLIRCRDTNDYAEVTARMEPVLAVARETKAALLLVHHAGKSARAGVDAVLGSTALSGTADNVFVLARSESHQRLLTSIQRIGEDLPETVLTLDRETMRVSLGPTRQEAEEQTVAAEILTLLTTTPNLTEREITDQVEGRTEAKRRALRGLYKQGTGRVAREGRGGRGDSFRYRLADSCSDVPSSIREHENTNPPNGLNDCADDTYSCPQEPGAGDSESAPPEHDPIALASLKTEGYDEV